MPKKITKSVISSSWKIAKKPVFQEKGNFVRKKTRERSALEFYRAFVAKMTVCQPKHKKNSKYNTKKALPACCKLANLLYISYIRYLNLVIHAKIRRVILELLPIPNFDDKRQKF